MNLKGALPTLILHVLESGPKHGYHIAQDIKAKSEEVLAYKEGTLYPTLHGLENKGLITADERVENGRTRRYYRLTEDGHKVLEKEREDWARMSNAINLVLGTA